MKRILYLHLNIYQLPFKGSGQTSQTTNMTKAFESLGNMVVFYQPAGVEGSRLRTETSSSLDSHRRLYRRIRRHIPRSISTLARDIYSSLYDFAALRTVKALAQKLGPDLVYERYNPYRWSGYLATAGLTRCYMLELHEPTTLPEYVPDIRLPRHNARVLSLLASRANKIRVVSSFLKKYLVDLGIDSDKIIVIPNAADPEVFRPMGKREEVRRKYRLENAVVLGFVGTMKFYHGHFLFPQLLTILRQKVPGIKLLAVGRISDQNERKLFYRELQAAGVRDMVVHINGVDFEKVPQFIEAMDVCFMADSNDYGSPIKLFEYGAMKKCTVMPDYGPVLDVMEHEVNGLIFRQKDVHDMAAKLALAMTNSELKNRLAERLYKDVLRKHTWKQNAKRIIESVGLEYQ